MSQLRLNHSMVLHVYNDQTDRLYLVNVANEFISMGNIMVLNLTTDFCMELCNY